MPPGQIFFAHIGTNTPKQVLESLPEQFTYTHGMEGEGWGKVRRLMGAIWEAYFGSEQKGTKGLLSHKKKV